MASAISQRALFLLAIAALVVGAVSLGYSAVQIERLRLGPGTEPIERRFLISSDFVIGSNRFTPSTITVFQGDYVHLILTNRGEIVHSYTISEYGVDKDLPVGETVVVEFSADKVGAFRFFCKYHPPHIGGQLVVLPR